jgi:outer membrane protein assembly factor BamB
VTETRTDAGDPGAGPGPGTGATSRTRARPWLGAAGAIAVVAVIAGGMVSLAAVSDVHAGTVTSPDPVVARILSLTSWTGLARDHGTDGDTWISSTAQSGTFLDVSPSLSRLTRSAINTRLGQVGHDGFANARVSRVFRHRRFPDGKTEDETLVYMASHAGLELMGFVSEDGTETALDPPLIALPRGPRPGAHWTGHGTWGSSPYRQSGRIAAAKPVRTTAGTRRDCITVTTSLQVGTGPARADVETICPGIGSIRERYRDDTGPRRLEWVAAGTGPATASVPGRAEAARPGRLPGGDPARWELSPMAQPSSQLNSSPASPPAVIGGDHPLVLAADGRTHLLSAYAPDTTGSPSWTVGLSDTPHGRYGVDQIDGSVYVGTPDGLVHAFSRAGEVRWVAETGDNVAAAPVRVGSRVVVAGEDGRVRAFDHATGARRWTVKTGTPSVADPVDLGHAVAVADDDGTVRALRAADGHELWSHAAGGPVTAGLRRVGDDVVVMTRDGVLVRIDGHSGDEVWSAPGGGAPGGEVTVSGDHVVSVDGDGWVEAYRSSDGHRTYRRSDLDAVGMPAPTADGVVVARRNGTLVALDRAGRTTRAWSTKALQPARVDAPRSTGFLYGPTAGAGAVWALDDGGTLWRLGPPVRPARMARRWVHMIGELHDAPRLQAVAESSDGAVVVDFAGTVWRVDRRTGDMRTLGTVPTKDATPTSATATGHTLLVEAPARLTSFDIRTGKVNWSKAHARTLGLPPTVWGSRVTIRTTGDDSSLTILELADGKTVTSLPTGQDAAPAQPVVCGDTLVSSAGPGTVVLIGGGAASRPVSVVLPNIRTFACDGDRVFVIGDDAQTSFVQPIDLATAGAGRLAVLGPDIAIPPWEMPQVVGHVLAMADIGGDVVGFDTSTLKTLWTHTVPGGRSLGIAGIDGSFWAVSTTGITEVLDPETGAVQRSERGFGERVDAYTHSVVPVVDGGRVVLAGERTLWAVDREDHR